MKDALGHGSNAGVHSQAIQNLPAKMGRRHFEQIAQNLRDLAQTDPAGHAQRVQETADKLATTNPNFNREMFVRASQPGTDYKNRSTRDVTKANASKQLSRYRAVQSNTGFGMSTRKYRDKSKV